MGAPDPESTILLVLLMIVTSQTNTSSFERLCGSTMSLLGMFGSTESDLLEYTWLYARQTLGKIFWYLKGESIRRSCMKRQDFVTR
jgi:hypothetical protein